MQRGATADCRHTTVRARSRRGSGGMQRWQPQRRRPHGAPRRARAHERDCMPSAAVAAAAPRSAPAAAARWPACVHTPAATPQVAAPLLRGAVSMCAKRASVLPLSCSAVSSQTRARGRGPGSWTVVLSWQPGACALLCTLPRADGQPQVRTPGSCCTMHRQPPTARYAPSRNAPGVAARAPMLRPSRASKSVAQPHPALSTARVGSSRRCRARAAQPSCCRGRARSAAGRSHARWRRPARAAPGRTGCTAAGRPAAPRRASPGWCSSLQRARVPKYRAPMWYI